MSRTLVACFSATGNTAAIARLITEIASADFFPIVPVRPYSDADLDWNDRNSRSSVEMNDRDCRPQIADKVADMAEYKTVFLGFPIWWYDAPRIILTFLDSYDFTGKAMIPFVTSGSSGLGQIPENLRKACPAAHWLAGKRFAPGAARGEIAHWLEEYTGWKK